MPPQQTEFPLRTEATKSRQNCLVSKSNVEVGYCEISEIGLENFINRIVDEADLNVVDKCEFNLNEKGIMHSFKDVYDVEATYSRCLGISKRLYTCNSYTHEPDRCMCYLVLEEFNERTYSFLPEFSCHILIFCWYDKNTRSLTKVSVQYDQQCFFLHCFGIIDGWRWFVGNIVTPPAGLWAKMFLATGYVNPFTFWAQIFLFFWVLSKLLLSS